LADVLRALGHPLRLRILFALRQTRMRVGDLGAFLDAAQPIVSQQLRILRLARLVESSREPGRPYQLASASIAALLDAVEVFSEGEQLRRPARTPGPRARGEPEG
jgi:DNA-binding transcriptional ArsR family regulator